MRAWSWHQMDGIKTAVHDGAPCGGRQCSGGAGDANMTSVVAAVLIVAETTRKSSGDDADYDAIPGGSWGGDGNGEN